MRKVVATIATLCFVATASGIPAKAAGPREKIRNIVHQVKAYCSTHTLEECKRAVSPDGQFGVKKLGENYAFILRDDGVMIAHGANARFVGKNFSMLRDPTGKLLVKAMVSAGKKGGGYIPYKWVHPVTKKLADKIAYCEAFKDKYVICAGAYE